MFLALDTERCACVKAVKPEHPTPPHLQTIRGFSLKREFHPEGSRLLAHVNQQH